MNETTSAFPKAKQAVVVVKAAGWLLLAVAIAWACISSAPAFLDRFQAFRQERRQADVMEGRIRVLDCIDAAKDRLPKPIPRDTLSRIEADCALSDVKR